MSDLISRQELLKLFVNLRDEHETASISYNALYELILKQPTAYDIEKVVAELKTEMNEAITLWDDSDYYTGRADAFEGAIEIVKAGGTT